MLEIVYTIVITSHLFAAKNGIYQVSHTMDRFPFEYFIYIIFRHNLSKLTGIKRMFFTLFIGIESIQLKRVPFILHSIYITYYITHQ